MQAYRDVIQDITRRMAEGMSYYAGGVAVDVVTLQDWDDYCHHVAGIVVISMEGGRTSRE
jgi:phytoene/squalene synthetase